MHAFLIDKQPIISQKGHVITLVDAPKAAPADQGAHLHLLTTTPEARRHDRPLHQRKQETTRLMRQRVARMPAPASGAPRLETKNSAETN
jgi:hypothetical protein